MRRIYVRKIPASLRRRAAAGGERAAERRFKPRFRHDPGAPPLLLSPHWDDAALGAWSVLREGGELAVANVFAAPPPPGVLTRWDELTGGAESLQRWRERIAEDDAALAHAGRQAVGLPLLDAEYRLSRPPHRLGEVDAAVSAAFPAASHVYAPAAIGGNADHLLVRRYARMLVRSGVPVSLYADVPYCVQHGWPDWVDGRERDPYRDVDVFWDSYLVAVPEMPALRSATATRLDDTEAAAKLAALEEYRSQIPSLSQGGLGLLRDPAIHRFEVRWELRRP